MPSNAQVIEAVERRLQCQQAIVRTQMRRGLTSLATIASTAPWIGGFGTYLGMVGSFKGCNGDPYACMAATVEEILKALVPTAFGLLVAVPAFWFYKYLSSEMEVFDIEMENVSVELVNHLRRRK